MNIGVFLAIILLALVGGAIGWAAYLIVKKKKNKLFLSILFSLAGLFALLFLTIPFSIHTVNAGEVAVVKHLGSAKKVRTSGTYFDFWLTEKYTTYDAKVQDLEIKSMAYSKDAQTMDIVMTVQYQIDTNKVIQIANQYGNLEVLSNRIESIAIEKTKSVLSGYSAMNIIETRAQISPMVETAIKTAIDDE